ncbi:hypothetical protein BDZ88DRAFT_453569 [Geranomyces variabilis]|nr:hypothetical protein BDZ88DRAFT_453569 [Geranomyces variabilis]
MLSTTHLIHHHHRRHTTTLLLSLASRRHLASSSSSSTSKHGPAKHIPQTGFTREPTSSPPSGMASMDPQEGGVSLKNEGVKPKDGFVEKQGKQEKAEKARQRAAEEKIKP